MNQSYSTPEFRPNIRLDPRLAARMMRAYNDQLNQVITYTYQHLLTEGLDTEASDLFLRLSREDMAHFHTLGRLIRALGGDPGVTMRMRTPRIDLTGDATCRALPVVRRMLRQDLRAEAESITELVFQKTNEKIITAEYLNKTDIKLVTEKDGKRSTFIFNLEKGQILSDESWKKYFV